MGEIRYMQMRKLESMQWINDNPDEYEVRVIKRIIDYWTGKYQVSSIYLFYGEFKNLKMVLYSLPSIGAFVCLILMMRERHKALLLCLGILILYPIAYYITHIELRQRTPIEPFLWILTIGVIFLLKDNMTLRPYNIL